MEALLNEIQEALLNYSDDAVFRLEVEFITRRYQARLEV